MQLQVVWICIQASDSTSLVYVAVQHYITVERRNDMMTTLVGWGNFSCFAPLRGLYNSLKKGLINYGTARAELALRHNHYF
jgi:hypothetical protein